MTALRGPQAAGVWNARDILAGIKLHLEVRVHVAKPTVNKKVKLFSYNSTVLYTQKLLRFPLTSTTSCTVQIQTLHPLYPFFFDISSLKLVSRNPGGAFLLIAHSYSKVTEMSSLSHAQSPNPTLQHAQSPNS